MTCPNETTNYQQTQADGYKGPLECNSGTSPTSDPNNADTKLGPYQLTVMNSLYLVQAARLYTALKAAGGDPRLAQAEEGFSNQLGWFVKWFKDYAGLYFLSMKGTALVLERPTRYKNMEEVEHSDLETAWTADQGMVLGGIAEGIAAKLVTGRQRSTANQIAQALATGVQQNMNIVDELVIDPWYPSGTDNKLYKIDKVGLPRRRRSVHAQPPPRV